MGRFELDLPVSQARNINISGYDIWDQANIGNQNPAFAQHNVNNQFTMADAMNGMEISGGHQYGGYHYSLALVDQNTSGVSQSSNSSTFVPSPDGLCLRLKLQRYLWTLFLSLQSGARSGQP